MHGFDLVLTCEEDEDVAFGLSGVDLEDGGDCCVEVVCFWLGSVMDVDRELTTGNCSEQVVSRAIDAYNEKVGVP